MKIITKPIEMVSWTDALGNINPVRFKITKDDENQVRKLGGAGFEATIM
ncbi:hypothetical protein [Clostridium sp. CF012]|nr:hypothetical protein [Clostridium sp. CF012]MBU3145613.1 hypothetical protein [Clostridium sp. CF012]